MNILDNSSSNFKLLDEISPVFNFRFLLGLARDCGLVKRYRKIHPLILKDKKIELLAQVTPHDEEGFATTTLEAVCPHVWAYFRQLSGKEVFAVATTNYKEEVLFVINHRPDLTTAHVVRYNSILYDITRIDTFEGYKSDLVLYYKTE